MSADSRSMGLKASSAIIGTARLTKKSAAEQGPFRDGASKADPQNVRVDGRGGQSRGQRPHRGSSGDKDRHRPDLMLIASIQGLVGFEGLQAQQKLLSEQLRQLEERA